MVGLPAFGVFQGKGNTSDDFGAFARGLQARQLVDERQIDQQAAELSRGAAGGDQNALQALLGLRPELANQIQQFAVRGSQEGRAQRSEASNARAEQLQFIGTALQGILDTPKEQRASVTLKVLRGFQQRGINLPEELPDPDDPNFEAELQGEILAAGQEVEKVTGTPFTLGPGQQRFDEQGNPVASVAPASKLLTPEEEAQKTRLNQAGATQVNVGGDGIDYGPPEKGFAWARDENGNVALEVDPETGLRRPRQIAIAGGTVEAKRVAGEEKAGNRATERKRVSDVVTEDIDRSLELVDGDFPVTGLFSLSESIPGTPAHDAARLIDTIKANIGFDKLQAMRTASPTGGALGQVSNFENKMLQATFGNLSLSQRKEQLQFNLERVKKLYIEIVHNIDSEGRFVKGPRAGELAFPDQAPEPEANIPTFRIENGTLVPVE